MVREPEEFRSRIRVAIAGNWTVPEFAELMSQIQFITGMILFLDAEGRVRDGSQGFFERWQPYSSGLGDRHQPMRALSGNPAEQFRLQFRQLMEEMKVGYSFQVERVRYASPGSLDVSGFGKMIEETRLFIKDILDRRDSKESRKIKDEIAKQKLLRLKIENAERLIKLRGDAALDDPRMRLLVAGLLSADAFFSEKVINGQVTDIKKVEEEKVEA
jgi:hypothetical protein